MYTKMTFFGLLLTLFANSATAQSQDLEVVKTISKVFEGMRKADTTLFRSAFHPSARLLTTAEQKGQVVYQYETVDNFVAAIAQPHDQVWDERIWSYEVRVDGGVAMAWTEYTFFVDTVASHCGVNAFTLLKTKKGWKIVELADTRRATDCRLQEASQTEISKEDIHKMLNKWHNAAATADEETFFGLMTEDCIYLGTDPSERWLRDELKKWSEKAFAKDVAWAFTPHDRELYVYKDGELVWFEELLDTWMGPCRGSGVVKLVNGEWKLQHYNLAVTIKNDDMDSVRQITMKGEK